MGLCILAQAAVHLKVFFLVFERWNHTAHSLSHACVRGRCCSGATAFWHGLLGHHGWLRRPGPFPLFWAVLARYLRSRLHPRTPPCCQRIRRWSLAMTRFVCLDIVKRQRCKRSPCHCVRPDFIDNSWVPLNGACRNVFRGICDNEHCPNLHANTFPEAVFAGFRQQEFQRTTTRLNYLQGRNCFRLVSQQDAVDWILNPPLHDHGCHHLGQQVRFSNGLDPICDVEAIQAPRDDTGESAVDTRRRRDISPGRGRSSSTPRTSCAPISPRRRSPSPASSKAPSFGPRPRSTSPHNKQDAAPVEPTITKGIIEDPAPTAPRKAPPPLDLDDEVPKKRYVKPAPLHLLCRGAQGQTTSSQPRLRHHAAPAPGASTAAPKAPPPRFIDVHDPWNDDEEDIEEVVTPIMAMARAASPVRVHQVAPQLGEHPRVVDPRVLSQAPHHYAGYQPL